MRPVRLMKLLTAHDISAESPLATCSLVGQPDRSRCVDSSQPRAGLGPEFCGQSDGPQLDRIHRDMRPIMRPAVGREARQVAQRKSERDASRRAVHFADCHGRFRLISWAASASGAPQSGARLPLALLLTREISSAAAAPPPPPPPLADLYLGQPLVRSSFPLSSAPPSKWL